MLTNLFLALSLYLSPATADTRCLDSRCETVGPRLDGSMVQICDGKVTSVFMLGEIAPKVVTIVQFDTEE